MRSPTPGQFGMAPHALNERAPGFGLVIFNKKARTIRFENYPRWADLSRGKGKITQAGRSPFIKWTMG